MTREPQKPLKQPPKDPRLHHRQQLAIKSKTIQQRSPSVAVFGAMHYKSNTITVMYYFTSYISVILYPLQSQ